LSGFGVRVYTLAVTMANLMSRAVASGRWYRKKFPDYPEERKILIPFAW